MDIFSKIADAGRDLAVNTGGIGNKVLAALVGVDASQLDEMLTALNQPSLCYVPIQSESLVVRRTVDVGTTMLITQTNQKKDYITDNAAPHPRTWTVSGYITTLVPLFENYLVIKPSLQVQMAILDAAADSRQTVKFKTDTGEVVDVLVQDLQITSLNKGNNVKQVTFTVQEVKVLENSYLSDLTEALSDTAAKSIPLRAVTNLGKNSAVASGVSNLVTGILGIHL